MLLLISLVKSGRGGSKLTKQLLVTGRSKETKRRTTRTTGQAESLENKEETQPRWRRRKEWEDSWLGWKHANEETTRRVLTTGEAEAAVVVVTVADVVVVVVAAVAGEDSCFSWDEQSLPHLTAETEQILTNFSSP